MPIPVSCPACGKEYNVKDEAAGKKFKCKECEAVVDVPSAGGGPRDDYGEPDNPFGDADPFGNLDFGQPAAAGAPAPRRKSSSGRTGRRSSAMDRLNGPAIGMMITAGIGMLGALGWGLLVVAAFLSGPPAGQNMGPEVVIGFVFYGGCLLFGMVLLILVMFGALKMKRGESYGLAMTASVIATIPCLTPCICMPFGIWGLVVLNDDAVKAAFR